MNPERLPEITEPEPLTELPVLSSKVTKPLRRFLVRHSSQWDVVPIGDVDWIESVRNYVILHCGTKQHVIRDTLINLEQRLPSNQFIRISRSAVVAFDRIQSLGTEGGESLQVVLRDGKRLPASRGVRELIRRIECA